MLDILFVAEFHWGVAGAAIATVIAQAFSRIVLFPGGKKNRNRKSYKRRFQESTRTGRKTFEAWHARSFSGCDHSVGGLVVQYVVNGYGFLFVAGFTATNKLYESWKWRRSPMVMPLSLM